MASPDPSSSHEYVIDIEEAAETGRLMEQARLYTKAMGGVFPEPLDLTPVKQILDIACGPGGWAIEVAFEHPDKEIVGIDINETMIRYAFAQARVRKLQHVTFEVMDATKPLKFHDASFDLINARLLVGFMDRASWPRLLVECKRLLRPGGIVRLTEFETVISSSAALQRLQGCLYQVLSQQGRTFSVDGSSMGVTHMLGRLMQQAGFENIEHRAFSIDGSFNSELHYTGIKDAEVLYSLLKPYLIQSGVIAESEYERQYQQMLADFLNEEYAAISYGLTAWATKPL